MEIGDRLRWEKKMCYRVRGVRCIRLLALTMILAFLSGAEGGQLIAATYYLSPTGSDGNSGTSASPWKTFNYAVPKLRPGDTLILKDGTYSDSNSGFVSINCSSGSSNGTASAPITIKAENERQAHIQGDGSDYPFLMNNCSYWNLDGLYISNADKTPSATSEGNAVKLFNCHHLYAHRLLVYHNNRYLNGALFSVLQTDYSLFEENELYYYHRNGMTTSSNNVFRRNYINSRDCPDIPGGRYSSAASTGDSGICVYPGSNNIIENNIVERTYYAYNIEASDLAVGNKFLGCIAINNPYGTAFRARGSGISLMPRDTVITSFLGIGSGYYGAYLRGNKNTQITNSSFFSNQSGGLAADLASSEMGDGNPTIYATNILSINNAGYGLYITSHADWSVDYPEVYNNGTNSSPGLADSHITNSKTVNPQMGACYAWIPASSPMKGAGKNGGDIGANILYRYENGVLTSTPLWDPSTGAFPCGAIVAGINDVAGGSCSNVHERLNINCNGCSFPAGYGQNKSLVSSPPSSLRIVAIQ
jgi:hypothetical protein